MPVDEREPCRADASPEVGSDWRARAQVVHIMQVPGSASSAYWLCALAKLGRGGVTLTSVTRSVAMVLRGIRANGPRRADARLACLL
jgi:hypothetical protein